MIMGRLSELLSLLVRPGRLQRIDDRGCPGRMAQTWLAVWSRSLPSIWPRNGPLAHIPLVERARGRTKKATSTTATKPRAETGRKRPAASRSCRRTLARRDPSRALIMASVVQTP